MSNSKSLTSSLATVDSLPSFAPDLIVVDGKVTTTSLQVAAHFGKRHADVIRAIKNMEGGAEFTERNFALSEFTDSTGRKLPCYQISRDGFAVLAMGFTGKEAMQWKIAYLETFNRMESELLGKEMQHLREATIKALPNGLAPAQQRCLQVAVAKKATALPKAKRRAGYPALWGGIKSHFQVGTYKDLSESQLPAALSFVESYEWELVDETPKAVTLNETVARLVKQVETPNGAPPILFMPLVEAVNRKLKLQGMMERPAGKIMVDVRKLAAIFHDLGRLQRRVDGLGILESDLPPEWWQANAISQD